MATPTLTAHVFPSSGATTGSGVAWTTPANAVSEDATSTTSALTKSATTSQTLRVTGFNFSAIPVGAIITGVEVRVKRSTAGATVNDNSVRLSLSGASIGTNLASATNYPTTLTWAVYGGSSEMWGTTLTEAQIKDSTFGVDISVKLSGTTSRTVSVDAISVAVAYFPPGVYLEATDQRDIASGSIEVPVVASLAVTDQRDIASITATVPTLTISHVATGDVAVAQNSSGSGAIITVPLPADWAVDDIFIMQVTVDSTSPPSLISGWTRIATLTTTALYWRRAQAGDADPTFTCSPGYMNYVRASISAWRNASTADSPIDSLITGSSTQPNGGYGTCPSVSVASPGSVIFSIATYSTGTISFSSPFTNIHQISQSFGSGTTAVKAADSAGAASGGSFTGWAGGSHPVASFVLMPAPDLSGPEEPEEVTVTLAATDQYDVASISATVTGTVSLAATDQRDAVSGTVSITGSASLAVTDQRDVASGSTAITGTVSLAVTDQRDTASISATVPVIDPAIDYGFIRHNGSWFQPQAVFVKNAGSWIEPNKVFVKKSGVWTLVKGTP